MIIKQLVSIIAIILLMGVLMSSSCTKNCEYGFQFKQDISIYPNSDTIHLGDTFYIEIQNPTRMWNSKQEEYVELKDYPPIFEIRNCKLTTDDRDREISYHTDGRKDFILRNDTTSFEYINIKGEIHTKAPLYYSIYFDIENDSFIHKSAIIARDTGQFLFMFVDANAYSIGTSMSSVETDCYKRWYVTLYSVNNNNTNFYLLENLNIRLFSSDGYLQEDEKLNYKNGTWSLVVKP